MKLIKSVCLAILIFPIIILGQKSLNFDLDYARFNYDSTSSFVEFYYSLNPQGMQASQIDKEYEIEAIVNLEMKNLKDQTLFISKKWKIQDRLSSSDSLQKSLIGVIGFIVPEGKYSIKINANDSKNPNFKKMIQDTIEIKPINKKKFSISDIQLATSIKQDDVDVKSIFYKNTFEVTPNPSVLFSNLSPVFFYYSELYNLILKDTLAEFNLQKILQNSSDKVVYISSKTIKQSKSSIVEIGHINLSNYPTGIYNFTLNLSNSLTKQSFISSKTFYLYNPKIVDSSSVPEIKSGVAGSEFGIYTEEECDKMFKEIKYIATTTEISVYGKIKILSTKRDFLYKFWNKRNTDPSTLKNKYKEDYMKRVEYANDNFGRRNYEGYLTDRGKIYLTYGQPDQRDLYPNESQYKPYEIWFYNQIEGGVYFYFGDLSGFGNYVLLNSTKKGEFRDDNWMDRISIDK
jgi:GWxTD domain-containing protein